ncbi:hypothetical protein [Bradyrhizobium sp. JR3.5]
MQLRSPLILGFAAVPLAALADPVAAPSPKASSTAASVQVQPRGNDFMPNSLAEDAVQKRITDFNRKQEDLEADLDKKLKICRGC